MKDTQAKSTLTLPLPPKQKLGAKREKMAAKKTKEHKTPILKVGKPKKGSVARNKAKATKGDPEQPLKRKRGRPKNEDRANFKKSLKLQKSIKKSEDVKTAGRKRKISLNPDIKQEKEFNSQPLKKPKVGENKCSINGDTKLTLTSIHKPLIPKGEAPPVVENSLQSTFNTNGTLYPKKSATLSPKKPAFSILKSATFHPPPRKDILNGNGNTSLFKIHPNKTSKPLFKKETEPNLFAKETSSNFKYDRFNSIFTSKEARDFVNSELSKFQNKEAMKCQPKDTTKDSPKPVVKEAAKPQIKDPVKPVKDLSKSQPKDVVKVQPKEVVKVQPKEVVKVQPKDLVKVQSKDVVKVQSKDVVKVQPKDLMKVQPKELIKFTHDSAKSIKEPVKLPSKEPVKSGKDQQSKLQAKDQTKPQTTSKSQVKEAVKTKPKDSTKTNKDSLKPLPKEPVKSHPQRMASLDAMAKMHVICTTDRKPPEPKHTSAAVSNKPFSQQKSITQCHERIQFDLKKETNDIKGNIVHKQEINFVKEKKQVFVSHSVEQSSIVEHEQSKTVNTKLQLDKEKNKKAKPADKLSSNVKKPLKNKLKQNSSSHLKLLPKSEKAKCKSSKGKDVEKKSAKVPNKVTTKSKSAKEKSDGKSLCKKTKKVEQTKSEVKVKETIRMQKTCTYQSVTTLNSHGAADSSVVPVSHVGMTTNYSKTKKTVVTDEECKNKVNFSTGSVVNNSYCVTTDRPCSISSHTDCCKFHAHPQIIPLAHMQACSLGHNLNRPSDTSPSSSHCSSIPVHRFGHQKPVIFSPASPDCGCCCSSSVVKSVHDTCLLRKSMLTYPHHMPSHHSHHSVTAIPPEAVYSDCHPSNSTVEPPQRRHYTIPSPSTHSRVACCACCELHHESNQHRHQSSLQYVSQPKTSSSLVPCEQTPLDLSTSSSVNIESDISLSQGRCGGSLCCRDLVFLRTSPHSFGHKFTSNKGCCRCSKQIICEAQAVEPVQSLSSCSNNKSILKIGQPQSVDHVTLLASPASQGSVPPIASTSGITNSGVPHIITDDGLVTAKREKSVSPKQSSKPSVVPKKRIFSHGWSWKGKPRERLIALTNDSVPCPRTCYPSVQHKEGDTINERDCVLLRSGPKDTDLPYVAKIAAFWENPDDGEMMMSLLWYYRPEHTDQGRKPGQMEDEVFASRHKDVNSVACIEDKCYVLTYNEYCRYKASLCMDDDMVSKSSLLVPELPEGYPRKNRLPCELVAHDIVFFCRHVYDFRQKRILKNPT